MNAEEPKTDPEVLFSRWELLSDYRGCGTAFLDKLEQILSQHPSETDLKVLRAWIFDFVNCGVRLIYTGPADEWGRRVLGPAYGDNPVGWLGRPLYDRIFNVVDRLDPWTCGLEQEDLVSLDDGELRCQIESTIRDCSEKELSLWPEVEAKLHLSDPHETTMGLEQDDPAEK
jgi:hypothetical protein